MVYEISPVAAYTPCAPNRSHKAMFQIVLIAVIAYLAACYGYGMFLLWKLYSSRPAAVEEAAAQRQERAKTITQEYVKHATSKSTAKAA